ncbi:hypothetical protein ACWD6L_00230 [Micromonospora profundi]|uniref:PRC-barrel domain-containing protein n=1 Tax=Micromonospora profundi TaxID=1420889 RepID=A0AAJ6L607_9ACTN|nr:hypothetical protein [Micromonospora profundi]NJC15235.1 hypothetical protein [Micromonospora profundi]WLS46753.1 hypothetical protein Q3V37_05645 [Micromonospora profundi]
MDQQDAQQATISRITTGMPVIDVAGTEIGTVDLVQRGDPNAVTVQSPTADPGSSLDELIEATAVEEPDVPADLAARLLHTGYLKVSTESAGIGAVYVPADRIAAVADGRVSLTVDVADLPPEE